MPRVAYSAYKKAAELSPVGQSFFDWGEAAAALGLFEEAFNAYRRAMGEDPSSLPAVYNTAYTAEKVGRPEAEGLFRKAVELFENKQGSRAARNDPNGLAAMALAYRAINRPDHALRLLRNARRLAEASDSPSTFFSPTAYTHVPKRVFIDDIDARVAEIESKYKELPQSSTTPTLLTAIWSQGGYVLTFKKGDLVQRRRIRTLSGVTEILTGAGIDPRSAAQYAEMLRRGHPVHVNVDASEGSIF
jgi:tetratricopeptide (TPR) repeat protein